MAIDMDGLEELDFRKNPEYLFYNSDGKLKVLRPSDFSEAEQNTADFYSYLSVFYNFYIHKVEGQNSLRKIGQKFGVAEKQIEKFNPTLVGKKLTAGDEVIVPPGEKELEELMGYNDVVEGRVAVFQRRRLQIALSSLLREKLATQIALLNETVRYEEELTVKALDVTTSLSPQLSPIKALAEVTIGKNVVYYLIYEVGEGREVEKLTKTDQFFNFISLGIAGRLSLFDRIKISNTTMHLGKYEAKILEGVGTINDTYGAYGRGTTSTTVEEKDDDNDNK